jgi:glutamate--cysteine ligase
MAPVMMKGTTSFQACFDFENEADCARKFDLMLRLSPLTTAMFANSPIFEGEVTGWMSNRGRAWQATDAARTGFPSQIRDGYSHERWVNYLLDVPMMFYVLDGEWRHANGKSFREFMLHGIDGHFPNIEDWDLHQTSVFPEVRVKQWIEVRGADACKMPLAIAGISFWKGLLYSDTALDRALEITANLSQSPEEDLIAAAKHGLSAKFGGVSALELAQQLFTVAQAGLTECDPEASHLLLPLEQQLSRGECPAREVLRLYKASESREHFLASVSY